MRSDQREELVGLSTRTCQTSRFLLGMIASQTPHLKPEAELIVSRVDELEREVRGLRRFGSARQIRKRVVSITSQVESIGLRSKRSMVEGIS